MHRFRTHVLLVALACLAVIFGLLTLGGVLSAASDKSTEVPGDVATAVVGLVLLVLSVAWAKHVHGRLHALPMSMAPASGSQDLNVWSGRGPVSVGRHQPLSPRGRTVLASVALIFPFAMGGVFLAEGITGILSVKHSQQLVSPVEGGVTTEGHVVSVHTSCFRGCTYQPTVTFTDARGTAHSFVPPYQDDEPNIGDTVSVSYDESNPSIAHDVTDTPDDWQFPLFTMYFISVLGFLALLIGGFAIRAVVHSRRRLRPNSPAGISAAR